MADILIRGLHMPDRRTVELMHTELACVSRECDRHCENCDLVQDRDELIVAFHEAIGVLEAVANAVPLPEGHGDLIDRDALKKRTPMVIDYSAGGFGTDGSIRPVRGYGDWQIDQAPTIVPAEGGTDDA